MTEATPHARLRGLTLEVAELRGHLGEVREQLAELVEAHRRTPSPFHWDDLDPEDRERREGALREWVSRVLTGTHPRVARRLPGCWFDHPHPRAVVTGSWLAWEGAYRAKGRKLTDPDDWLTRRLPALDAALRDAFGDGREPCEEHDLR